MNSKINKTLEENFHDKWASSININNIDVNNFFNVPTAPENIYILRNLGNIKNKKILDLGCGAGEAAVFFATKGANVTATDISQNMLNAVNELAKKYSVKVNTVKSDSDKINLPDNTFDIVYASNLLHHININFTLNEVKRILKNGGIFVSWDPIAHNPLINYYRKIATNVRTTDEHPIKINDIKIFKKFFKLKSVKGFWFFTLFIFIKYYFIDKIDPNKDRYWKKIINDYVQIKALYKFLYTFDKVILKIFPFLKWLCWNIVIIAKVKK